MRKHYAGKLTRTYLTTMLLKEKPLPFGEIVEVSGWTPKATFLALTRLMYTGDVYPVVINGKRHYSLAFWKPAG